MTQTPSFVHYTPSVLSGPSIAFDRTAWSRHQRYFGLLPLVLMIATIALVVVSNG